MTGSNVDNADTPLMPFTDLTLLEESQTAADGSGLSGSRCRNCQAGYFPRRSICFECRATVLDDATLNEAGVLYSWTVVHVSSSRPTPYTIGYVDLPTEGLRIYSDLLGDPERFTIDMPMALQIAEDGSWAFAPEGMKF